MPMTILWNTLVGMSQNSFDLLTWNVKNGLEIYVYVRGSREAKGKESYEVCIQRMKCQLIVVEYLHCISLTSVILCVIFSVNFHKPTYCTYYPQIFYNDNYRHDCGRKTTGRC